MSETVTAEYVNGLLAEIERFKIEATCNYCGEYHGREVCEKLLAVYEAAKAYKASYELSEGGISVDIEAELQQALSAVQTIQKPQYGSEVSHSDEVSADSRQTADEKGQ